MKSRVYFIISFCIISMAAVNAAAGGSDGAFIQPGAKAPDFLLNDQYIVNDRLSDHSGDIVVIINSGRHTSEYAGDLSSKLIERFCEDGEIDQRLKRPEKCNYTPIFAANLKGVPFFIKGRIKSHFKKPEHPPVLLDWKGEIARK